MKNLLKIILILQVFIFQIFSKKLYYKPEEA